MTVALPVLSADLHASRFGFAVRIGDRAKYPRSRLPRQEPTARLPRSGARSTLVATLVPRFAVGKEVPMLVSEILRIKGTTLFTTSPERPALAAVEVMAEHDIGSLVVMEHGRMAGMLTFAEVLQALAQHGGTLDDLAVEDLYQRDPLVAAPNLDVMELRRVMLERHARYVPVMEDTTLLGVVSFHDVAKAVYEDQSFENRMLKSYINGPDEKATV
jgi:CBS domain-containing protein